MSQLGLCAKQQRRSEHPARKAGASPEEHRGLPEGAFLLVFVARDEVITSAWLIAVKQETLVIVHQPRFVVSRSGSCHHIRT
jgi:hypothetical protein